MSKQSEDRATKIDKIDKSKKPSATPTNKDELSEQELDKASGGAIDSFMYFQDYGGRKFLE